LRFLADENVERAVVEALRNGGHDVLDIGAVRPGLDDEGVVRLAFRQRRIIITNDKDFGELLFLRGRRVPGLLLLRLPGRDGTAKASAVIAAVAGGSTLLSGRLVVVEPGRVRSRPLRAR